MTNMEDTLAPYNYVLPEHLIAHAPADPRDSAKLLVYNRKKGTVDTSTFAHIANFLPKNAVLVFNQTKVIPARFHLRKKTGGHVEALYVRHMGAGIVVLASGKFKQGDTLDWADSHSFTVLTRKGTHAELQPSFNLEEFHTLLEEHGQTPLPPYMHSPLTEEERRTQYQTVYAQKEGSVAAPTAGLHFTEKLLSELKEKGHPIEYVTLHVNLGTFAPLTEEHLQKKQLHTEQYEIPAGVAERLNIYKKEGRPIIAIGTTTVRTLESATRNGVLEPGAGSTNIFLTEDDTLQCVDGLITNFHVPKSSLLMLVSAFTGRETLMELYKTAIEKEFRFFSFGDGMLII